MAMLIKYSNPTWNIQKVKGCFTNPDCVSKAWPLFWEFIDSGNSIKKIYTSKIQI
jgi:hypothetical protein